MYVHSGVARIFKWGWGQIFDGNFSAKCVIYLLARRESFCDFLNWKLHKLHQNFAGCSFDLWKVDSIITNLCEAQKFFTFLNRYSTLFLLLRLFGNEKYCWISHNCTMRENFDVSGQTFMIINWYFNDSVTKQYFSFRLYCMKRERDFFSILPKEIHQLPLKMFCDYVPRSICGRCGNCCVF